MKASFETFPFSDEIEKLNEGEQVEHELQYKSFPFYLTVSRSGLDLYNSKIYTKNYEPKARVLQSATSVYASADNVNYIGLMHWWNQFISKDIQCLDPEVKLKKSKRCK